MSTSTNKELFYGEYINPTIDHSSMKKENPLVLMAQACNNIGKELTLSSSFLSLSSNKRTVLSPPTSSNGSKQRKSNSPTEMRKSLKRSAPSSPPTPLPPSKKLSIPPPSVPVNSSIFSSSSSSLTGMPSHSFYLPPPPFMFDSFFLHHLSKTLNSSSLFSSPTFAHSATSAFSPSSNSQRSAYLMDSILAPLKPTQPSFVCNWMESSLPDGFCGQRFNNQFSLLEHLCTSHTASSSPSMLKSSYPTLMFSSVYSPTSVGKL